MLPTLALWIIIQRYGWFTPRIPNVPNVIVQIASHGMICKYAVKIFKMLYPDIEDGLDVREAGTLHGFERTMPMSHIWIKRHTEFAGKSSDNVIDLEDWPYDFGSIGNQLKIDVEDPEDMFLQISIHEPYSGPIGQYTVLLHD